MPQVEVHTSNLRSAGTDANVTMTLFGAKGDTGPRVLANSRNDFERGHIDEFFFDADDIGARRGEGEGGAS